jgi:hypothetical protein
MKSISGLYLLTISVLIFSCSTTRHSKQTTSTNIHVVEKLQPVGRYFVNEKKQLELISSASHVGFTFEGKTCNVMIRIHGYEVRNYIQYELDGVYQKRIRIDSGATNNISINSAEGGKHTVWLYKTTEAHTGPVIIEKIEGENVQPVAPSMAPFIEFIGNSITCGAAADTAEIRCGGGFYHDQHNAYFAYGPRVARALKVNFMLSSVSGIGIYRNWNSDGPTMPQVYDYTNLLDDKNGSWDFSKFNPAIVSIALGTNDFSNGDGKKARLPFDSALFVSNYIQFVQKVKTHYPNAIIALLSSPMVNGERRELLQHCITAVKQETDKLNPSSKPVAVYFFHPMKAGGCSGHPSVEDHAVLAEELQPFFKNLLQ